MSKSRVEVETRRLFWLEGRHPEDKITSDTLRSGRLLIPLKIMSNDLLKFSPYLLKSIREEVVRTHPQIHIGRDPSINDWPHRHVVALQPLVLPESHLSSHKDA